MLSKRDVINVAKDQLAKDYNCKLGDFFKEGNTLTSNDLQEGSRPCTSEDCMLKVVCIEGRAIFSAHDHLKAWLDKDFLGKDAAWLFDFGNLRLIDQELKKYGQQIDQVPQYYLPDPGLPKTQALTDIRWFEQDEIDQFRGDDRFGQAFVFDPDAPDVIGVAALEGDKIIAMAGASADSDRLYQVGIDVLADYRGRGIGSNLVGLLKDEILKRGKIPFYGTSSSHLFSRNIAIKAGFFPAWVELYAMKLGGNDQE